MGLLFCSVCSPILFINCAVVFLESLGRQNRVDGFPVMGVVVCEGFLAQADEAVCASKVVG